jgi:phosphoribosylamine--glycine ligase
MNCNGDPYVIEYNVRLGDPETEAIIPRIENDFVEMFQKTLSGKLHEVRIEISEKYAVTVILASGGYPGDYEKGFEINGLDKAKEALIFHAGTKKSDTGSILTNGGRVMAVTALGETLELCREYVYNEIEKIHFQGVYYRKDIGKDLLQFQPLE